MTGFLVLATRHGRVLDEGLVEIATAGAVESLPARTRRRPTWWSTSRCVAVAGWSSTDAHADDARWMASTGRLVALGGQPAGRVPRTGLGQEPGRGPPPADRHDLWGVFTLLDARSDGDATVAADRLGVGALYVAETAPARVLSTHVTAAAAAARALGADDGTDVLGLGWLLFFEQVLGAATGFRCVRRLPPGRGVRIRRDGSWVEEAVDLAWSPGDAIPPEEALDLADAEIESQVEAAAGGATSIHLDLTGGRDSRLVLAYLVSLGLAPALTCRTWGTAGSSDVQVAALTAARLGVAHVVQPAPAAGRTGPLLLDDIVEAAQCSGGLLPVRLPASRPSDGSACLTGLFGELLRSFYAKDGRAGSAKDVRRFFHNRLERFGLGLAARPEARAHYLEEAEALVGAWLARGWSTADVPYLLYLEHRLPNWQGPAHEAQDQGPLHPLCSAAAVRLALRVGHQGRRSQHAVFAVMDRRCPALARLPFAEEAWPAPAYAAAPDAEAIAAIRPITGSGGTGIDSHVTASQLRETLLDDPGNPVFAILDHGAVSAVVDDIENAGRPTRRQLDRAVGLAMWFRRERREPTVVASTGDGRTW